MADPSPSRPAEVTARRWAWFPLLIGWLPVLVLYTLLLSPVNPIHRHAPAYTAIHGGLIAIGLAALMAFGIKRLTERIPWPHPFRADFLLIHLAAATVFSVTWVALKTGAESLLHRAPLAQIEQLLLANLVLGIWIYVMVAGVSYATAATARAAAAEASAARAQLDALRGQLNPHFLFNALHTVMHLIPNDPRGAARAAEQLAGLLRATLEDGRDLVTLGEERRFVERYLDIERIRFGSRLRDRFDLGEHLASTVVPSFALQTLVENAVRHAAAPRVEPTEITVEGRMQGRNLHLTVRDSGNGIDPAFAAGAGTGLGRLRERLAALYGQGARLDIGPAAGGGTVATLIVPQGKGDDGAR